MSEQGEKIKRNFLEQWVRILIMAAYILVIAILWPFIGALLVLLILMQALFSVVTGETNRYVTQTAESLAEYFHQILQFLIYSSDEKPFPFAPFPMGGSQGEKKNDERFGEDAEEDENSSDDVFSDMSFTDVSKDDEPDGKQDDKG